MRAVVTCAASARAIAVLEIDDELCIALAEGFLLRAGVLVWRGRGLVSAKICTPKPYSVSGTIHLA